MVARSTVPRALWRARLSMLRNSPSVVQFLVRDLPSRARNFASLARASLARLGHILAHDSLALERLVEDATVPLDARAWVGTETNG